VQSFIRNIIFLQFLLIGLNLTTLGQTGSIVGAVSSQNELLSYVNIELIGESQFKNSDDEGKFTFDNLKFGKYRLKFEFTGYRTVFENIELSKQRPIAHLNVEMEILDIEINQIVVTGTRTFERRTQSPVIVNVLGSKTLDQVQACNLSEGLKYQPGLRVETDCQTCNYTQLRMNGLAGGYSQILINGRPIFSPLTGLYGMEQLPVNMIERVEIVRGGGSALYGSSAIGGTVNVITKIPKKSESQLGWTRSYIDKNSTDNIISGNVTVVNKEGKNGITLFVNNRDRSTYDHNGDNYSELPSIQNNSFGTNAFFLPKENQKLELSLSSINEYRYGGEITDKPAHMALQSEERDHKVLVGSADYQINFEKNESSIIAYAAGQKTVRRHYTGITPDSEEEILEHFRSPPYGNSLNTTWQAGLQYNNKLRKFFGKENTITTGLEFVSDDVLDQIESYDYKIDQLTQDLGFYAQSNWKVNSRFTFLSGFRIDNHNLLDHLVASPRVSVLYKTKKRLQLRGTFGTGFRAPQSFDSDMHIAFAGGGVSRIFLSDNLKEERSTSYSLSANYDKVAEHWIAGFTAEAFYTHLADAFYLHPLGADQFGETFEKRNGSGSTVQGITLELRANLNKKIQLESGFTVQKSLFEEAVENIEGLEKSNIFLRTPNEYGYATLTWIPNSRWSSTLNSVYTGQMLMTHFAGAPEQEEDAYFTSASFNNLSIRISHNRTWDNAKMRIEFFGGLKNMTNDYQSNFDSGKNRDSNFIYGPSSPRSFYLGIKLFTL